MLAYLLSAAILPQGETPAVWTALPTPILCEARPREALPPPLSNGSHLLRANDGSDDRVSAPAGRLQLATFQKLLEETARETTREATREGAGAAPSARIEFFKSSTSLLARGDASALDAARRRIAELDRAAEGLAIDLEVEFAAAAPAQAKNGAPGNGAAALPERWTEKRRVLSGDEAFFGERKSTGFVMSFDVEVAADSGIATPVLGTAVHGRTLHLRAVRVDLGRKILLQGLLDLSDLTSLDRFDPETPDLGVLQEPALDFVQIAFAGIVESGGTLEVRVEGAPLAHADWKLSLKAQTRADDDATSKGDPAAPAAKEVFLDVLDLACVSSDPAPLAAAQPGAGLERVADFASHGRGLVAIPPSAIAAALDSQIGSQLGSGSAVRPATWWGQDLLVLRRSDAAARAQARALVLAAESSRLATCRIEARRGGLLASFPACAGSPARLLAGRESTALVGYRVEIAPQTWMAAPNVERVFDGIAVDAQVSPGAAECSIWMSKSGPATIVARADAQLGKLQVLSRSLRTERARIRAGEPERDPAARTPQNPASDAVVLRCLAP